MDLLQRWRTDYCAGSPMPDLFRENISIGFNQVYQQREDLRYTSELNLYRVLDPTLLVLGRPFKLNDNLYYSFSADLDGIRYFCSKDKHFKSRKFILIEAKHQEALDYQKLLKDYYLDYNAANDRYAKENEIVSKLSSHNLVGIYLVDLTTLADYAQYELSIEYLYDSNKLKTLIDWED